MRIVSIASFVLAGVFFILMIIARSDSVRESYQSYLDYLTAAEYKVAHMDDKFSIFLVIIFLYAFKSVFPFYLYPISALCTVTSAVFPAYLSIPINLIGLTILYSVKYAWGKKVGADGVQNILRRNKTVYYLIKKDGRGNPWLLCLFRLIPGIPVNQISKLYGAMKFKYKYFIMLSLMGYFPLLVSYTFIGRNVYNPFSVAFLFPFVLLFLLLGASMMGISKIVQIQTRRKN